MEALKHVLATDPRIAYALVFGSTARGTAHAHSDVDVAIGSTDGRRLTALELGDLASRLEAAVNRPVDVVDLEDAPPGLAYRIFRDGQILVETDRPRLVARRARAILEYLDFRPVEEELARGVLAAAAVVDRAILAARLAGVRDAVVRIRSILPKDKEAFLADRTAREVVLLNLFVALQDTLSLATHWLSDEGVVVPQSYREVFRVLGERGVIPLDLASRLAGAAGLRNLVAHQYAVLDWERIHEIASLHLDDLLLFCETLARRAEG